MPQDGTLKVKVGDTPGSSGGITGLPNQTCQSLVPTSGEYDIFLDNAVSGFRNIGPGDYGWDVAVCVTLAQPIAQDTAYIILEVQDSHQDEIEVTGGPWQTGDTLCGVLHVADADASAWDWVSVRTPTFAYANMYSGTLCWGQTPNNPVPAVEASQTWKRAGLPNPGGGTLNVLEIPASVDLGGGGGGSYWVEPGELGAATSTPIGGDGLNLTPGMLPPWLVQLYGGATTGTVTGDTDYWPFYAEDTDHVAVTSGQWFEVEQQDDYEVPANTTWTALTLWLEGNVTQVTVDGYQGGSVTGSVTIPVTATAGVTRVEVPWPDRLIDPTWGETAVITFRVTPAGTGLIRCHAASLAYGFPYGSAFYSDPVQDPASTYSPGGLSPTSWAAQAAYTNSPMPGASNAQYVLDDPPTVSSAYAALTGGMSSFYRCETLQIPGDDVQKDISTYAQRTRWFDIHSYPTVDDFDLDFFAHPGIIGHYFPVNGEYAWYDGDYAESPGLQGVDGVNHFQVPVGSTLELSGQVTVFDELNTAVYGGDPPEWLLRVVTSSVTGPQTANFRITYDGGFTSPPISQGDADTLYAPNWEGYANVSSQVFSHGAATPITPVSVGTGYAQQGRYVGVQLALNGGDYRNNLMVTTRSSYPATSTATATAFGVTRTFTPPTYRYIFAASGWDDTSPTPDPGGLQPQPGRWHTCDNHEPPPAGGQWGDGGVEPNWAHVSWMRLKDQPGSGRTGRMKIKMTDGVNVQTGTPGVDYAYPGGYKYSTGLYTMTPGTLPDTQTGTASWQNVSRWLADSSGVTTGVTRTLISDGTGQYFAVHNPNWASESRYDKDIGHLITVMFLTWDLGWATSMAYPQRYTSNTPANVVGWQYKDGPTHVGDRNAPLSAAEQSWLNTPLTGVGVWDGEASTYGVAEARATFSGAQPAYEPWALVKPPSTPGASVLTRNLYMQYGPNTANTDHETRTAAYRSGTANILNEASWPTYHTIPPAVDGQVEEITPDLFFDFTDGMCTLALVYRGSNPGATHLIGRTAAPTFRFRAPPVRYLYATPAEAVADGGTGEAINMTDGSAWSAEASWSSPTGSPGTVPDTPDSDEPTGGFAAVTYNMPGWVPNRQAELNDLLGRCSIIGLQEVNWFDDNNWDAQLPGWSFVQRDGKGQAVGWDTSKWVLQEWGWWKIADATSVQPAAAGPTNRPSSGVTWAVLRRQSTGGLLRFGTVHLTPSKHLGGAVLALYQTEVAGIADWWDSTSAYPTLLVGDFNGQPQDAPLGPLRNRAQVQAVTSFGTRSIDLLWSSGLTRTGVRAIGGHNSDHKPVRGTYTS